MQKIIAKILSVIIHPLLMPALGVFIICNTVTYISILPGDIIRSVFLIIFISTFILPVALIPFFIYFRLIRNEQMDERRQRLAPLIITVFLFYLAYYLLARLNIPQIIKVFMLSATITVALTFLVTTFWKISAHMTGVGGISGVLMAIALRNNIDLQNFLIISFLVSGFLAYARLKLNAHSPEQVYAGYGMGFVTMMTVMYIY